MVAQKVERGSARVRLACPARMAEFDRDFRVGQPFANPLQRGEIATIDR